MVWCFKAIIGVTVLPCFILSCNEQQSTLKELYENDGVKVLLTEKNEIYLSAPSDFDDTNFICKSSAGSTDLCETNATAKFELEILPARDGRKFFSLKSNPDIEGNSVYKIVSKNSAGNKVVGSFQFKDPNAVEPEGSFSLEKVLATISEETLKTEINYIASDSFKGRLSGSSDHVNASNWVVDELKKIGLAPGVSGEYFQKFQFTADKIGKISTHNIVAVLEGSDPALKDNYVVIGAHLDHAGSLSRGYTCSSGQGANEICNGADDNASGSVTLLSIARAMVKGKTLSKRSVIFIWFSGEEEGLKGSNHFVANPPVALEQIDYMINLDMVGYMRQYGNRIDAIGAGSSRFAYDQIVAIAKKYPTASVKYNVQAQGGSDHEPFMTKGIPAIFFHTGVSSNPNYHKTSDTPDKIDTKGMLIIAKMGIEQLVAVGNKPPSIALTTGERKPLLPSWEIGKSCHHLIGSVDASTLDFRYGSTGRPAVGEYSTD